jgi:hypothetical protein
MWHLFDLESGVRLHQDIGIHHGAPASTLMALKNSAAKQFEGNRYTHP